MRSGDLVTRARYAYNWGNGDQLHLDLAAEVEKLRADYDRAVQDWAENDASVLADSQRLAEENQQLRDGIETIRNIINETRKTPYDPGLYERTVRNIQTVIETT